MRLPRTCPRAALRIQLNRQPTLHSGVQPLIFLDRLFLFLQVDAAICFGQKLSASLPSSGETASPTLSDKYLLRKRQTPPVEQVDEICSIFLAAASAGNPGAMTANSSPPMRAT